ncbi:ABC transporter ATP-binding protein [Streptosporangium sp. KLBMP 9127]|nr:ABC transporter ATP-binding protein [Streptosporangium sp. KLBMP 9127]
MAVLEVSGLCKSFGETLAVDGLGFSVGEGETYGLLGPNGAGKTTAISMIAGVLGRDGGEVRVGGQRHHPAGRRTKAMIGYVPQEPALYPDLTGRRNLRFFARLHGLAREEAGRRAAEVLELVGLTGRGDDLVGTYSGGMARRLNIAAGLLNRPRLLILDEPTAGVDPQSRNAIFDAVRRLTADGVAVLYTTHYMEEAERLCDRVGILDGGRMRAEGTRRELVALVGERDQVTLRAEGDLGAAVRALAAIAEAGEVSEREDGVELLVRDARAVLPRILAAVTGTGASVGSVEVREPDLEAVFLHLTGRALRD